MFVLPGEIAYLMSRFPHLPETFILREMIELERLGWKIELYPLIIQKQSVVHAEARPWLERANHVPLFSLEVLLSNLRIFVSRPKLYISLWWRVFMGNLSNPGFLARAILLFPKSVRMAEMMKQSGIQHIHAHYATHPALVAWIIHKLTDISYTITVHAHDIFMHKTMLDSKVRDAAAVIAISQFNRRYLTDYLGNWVDEKIYVIHCGVDVDAYAKGRDPRSTSILQILSIGSLQSYKGHTYLVDACNLLRQKDVPFVCSIVGGGPLQDRLSEKIEELDLGKYVKLVGPITQQEVIQFLGQADCYVQPSVIAPDGQMEGIPVALMEAMASSVPVVATDISGITELVHNRETGLVVPPESSKELADAIAYIMYHKQDADKLATAGYEFVSKKFMLAKNAQMLADLFNGLVR